MTKPMTLTVEIMLVLFIKGILLFTLWYVWFSNPLEIHPFSVATHLFNPSTGHSK